MSNQQKIQRVPPLLLQLEKNKEDYFPEAASFGPYHHGEPKLAIVEAFKPTAVEWFISGDNRQEAEQFYYHKILEIIQEVRNCYDEQDGSIAKRSDPDLAQMMLRDAALMIMMMRLKSGTSNTIARWKQLLGMLAYKILWRDVLCIGNQIPLCVVKLLVDLRYGDGEYKNLLYRYTNTYMFGKFSIKPAMLRKKNNRKREPLHLLEVFHRLLVKVPKSKVANKKGDNVVECGSFNDILKRTRIKGMIHGIVHRLQKSWISRKWKVPNEGLEIRNSIFVHSFRTVKDLKAKGIYVKPSPTRLLRDVNFRSHFFYGRLELPEWDVSADDKAIFKNLVAYELSPNSPTKGEVAAYINLMKSLIEGPEDVKELRERRILFNRMGSDEEVVNLYKSINTYDYDNSLVFKEVKDQIEAHHKSIIKRWMAELFHNNFRSPWTAIAFLAAFTVLAIAAAQLYYAMHPPK